MKHGELSKIALKADLSRSFLCEIFKGKKSPSWPAAKRLAAVTDTDPVLWLEGTPEDIRAAIEAAEEAMWRKRREEMAADSGGEDF